MRYVIRGIERRRYKQRKAELQRYIATFWTYENINRLNGCGYTDEKCEELLEDARSEIMRINNLIYEKEKRN